MSFLFLNSKLVFNYMIIEVKFYFCMLDTYCIMFLWFYRELKLLLATILKDMRQLHAYLYST